MSSRSSYGIATYTCNTGYTLSGSSTRTCQTNGLWSETAPTCGEFYQSKSIAMYMHLQRPYAVLCPELSQPSDGTVTITSGAPGGRAIYTCNTGNNLIGSSTRFCLISGIWSGNAPTCQGGCDVGMHACMASIIINPRRTAAPRVIVVGQSVCPCILSLLNWMR